MAQSEDSEESKFSLRSYQEEMLEASLRGNVIVKMDTGSGKTAIAIARAEAALQGCELDKIVWLLAPTVVLCTQHSQTFAQRLPGYQVRLLVGSDGVDRWSDQQTWTAALNNIRVVISTYKVLEDALNNGFVPFTRLTLLIFDEIHNCTGDNPGAQLMRNFYPNATTKPAILGLSASIIHPKDFEGRFDCKVITPRKCRSELLNHVNRPVLKYLRFSKNSYEPSPLLQTLECIRMDYRRTTDPWVLNLDLQERVDFLASEKQTACQKELNAISQKAKHVFEQLGPDPVDNFIKNTVRVLLKKLDVTEELDVDTKITKREAKHLAQILRPLTTAKNEQACDEKVIKHEDAFTNLTPKVLALIDFLEREWTADFTGLIFVQQRALAYALAHLLKHHRFLNAQLRVEGFVGTSRVADPAKRLIEQVLPQDHKGVLEKFRSTQRVINLLVATEVLGEGVDVPQCHLVLCFDPPPRIISFVQKRGRARHKDSKYVLMFDETEDNSRIAEWQATEVKLDAAFQEEKRIWSLSKQLEDREERDDRRFRIALTGALLTPHNAIARLYHLCQSAQSQGFAGSLPQFTYIKHPNETITAKVRLPLCFAPELRDGESLKVWLTERVARRAVAYELLIKLYDSGLLNDHLLPLREEKEELGVETTEKKSSFCDILPTMNPWEDVAKADEISTWHTLHITITESRGHQEQIPITVFVPTLLPPIPTFTLYWNADVQYTIKGSLDGPLSLAKDEVRSLRSFTEYLLWTASGGRMVPGLDDFPFLVNLAPEEMEYWQAEHSQNESGAFKPMSSSRHGTLKPGVIWHTNEKTEKQRYLFKNFSKGRSEDCTGDVDMIEVTVFPKRRDFLHQNQGPTDAYTKVNVFAQSACQVEAATCCAVKVSFFLPAILRRIELGLVAQRLHMTLIPHLDSKALPSLQAAITSREALEAENYERLEFLGDAYINFITSLNLMVEQPLWPEGYLTEEKGRRVSNETFCKAALDVGLDKYIISKLFTGQRWTPPYLHKLKDEGNEKVERVEGSKKRVADVLEATLAVAYLDGGHASAIQLCKTYFPRNIWTTPQQQANRLASRADAYDIHLERLQDLIGYSFNKPSLLLEAMTTGAYIGGEKGARSYERLEFLGDAVLDYLVIEHIYRFEGKKLPHHAMHSIKTAIVNSCILSFLCMEHFSIESREDIVMIRRSPNSSAVPEVEASQVRKHIWQFIRPGSRSEKELKSLEKFGHMHGDIRRALERGNKYPWPLLCQFNPSKIFSDVIESILGAMYVDSHANNDVCNDFLRRIGLYKVLDHLLEDNVACMHPKELLGIAADRRKVEYVYGEKDKMITCRVLIDGRQVGATEIGEVREIAATVAAEKAVELEQQGKLYDMVEKAWKVVVEDKLGIALTDEDATEDAGVSFMDVDDGRGDDGN